MKKKRMRVSLWFNMSNLRTHLGKYAYTLEKSLEGIVDGLAKIKKKRPFFQFKI